MENAICKSMPLSTAVLIILLCACKNDDEPTVDLTVKDIDGNVYETVTIATQTWLKENLKVSHYNNGDPIPEVKGREEWNSLTTGAFCHHSNDPGHSEIYGKLYNFFVVSDTRGICPKGWHVPSNEEWDELTYRLGGVEAAGKRMKAVGTEFWKEPNTGALNTSGFTALPSGYRDYVSFSTTTGEECGWWTSSVEVPSEKAWDRNLYFDTPGGPFSSFGLMINGLCIRCLKDD